LLVRPTINGKRLVGRESGIVGDGVVNTGTVETRLYSPNTVNVDARTYNRYYERDNVRQQSTMLLYTKLRQVTFRVPHLQNSCKKIVTSARFLKVTGRNLILWTDNPHFDPETVSVSGGTLQPGIENMSYPSTELSHLI
jgi:hypothetical protein